jgi:hypothetical protein
MTRGHAVVRLAWRLSPVSARAFHPKARPAFVERLQVDSLNHTQITQFPSLSRSRIVVAQASHSVVAEMHVLCAWCCREGRPGYLGEREPLDNPESTHGVCARHKVELLESLPSRSFPDAELLVVVRRDRTLLYEQLAWLFAATPRVKVILERRVADEHRLERTRRIRAGTVSPLGDFILVRFTPKAAQLPAYVPRTIVPEHVASGAQRVI